MNPNASWASLLVACLVSTSAAAQTVPGSSEGPVKAVPQTERKLKPERVEEATPGPEEAAPAPAARAPRSARAPRGAAGGARGPQIGRGPALHMHGH
ncbi:hypothetical protein GCM10023172_29410 [Hymenobacter ginsengisoli]|uniref:Uncharacterized protein n=1 Tax=Hymenobacter ginsengisoli TaxID=1051626 RepID=A0ABP8QIY9_9BACT|nr:MULTISPECIES: hypothetical protein [unclassified Hymenobacter]MBO2029802.1 hypothetical protein [Hymenobacter sp. BT559]